ncbi:putative nucleosome assembly protein [Lachnellula occidentalis]|uniref:Putative nucleosome assembly protein n=1 Tax=Lachnellula occidentalis TaxID=215460 RepID=A0A8H8RS83_9HELO|nr:putative nucleosome assembly protein [Lachnellula occidentalis]
MAAALEETPVSYEDLAAIERDFDNVETEIIRKQTELTTPLYASRQKTLSTIPNFWPLVLEQAPPDIDQYIQPSDSALLLSSLTSFSVSRFEAPTEPRSISLRFEFSDNEYFEDAVLEKRFWYRRAGDGWQGLVSEPVGIKWREGRDLCGGLLGLVERAYASCPSASAANKKEERKVTAEQKELAKTIENTGMGGLSFFAFFGFIGRRISAEENAVAVQEAGKGGVRAAEDGDEGEDMDDLELDMSLEIFPDGEELALAFADDLWPGAIKYFTQAQEQDALSDADFEDSDAEIEIDDLDQQEDGADDDADARPTKKQRSS